MALEKRVGERWSVFRGEMVRRRVSTFAFRFFQKREVVTDSLSILKKRERLVPKVRCKGQVWVVLDAKRASDAATAARKAARHSLPTTQRQGRDLRFVLSKVTRQVSSPICHFGQFSRQSTCPVALQNTFEKSKARKPVEPFSKLARNCKSLLSLDGAVSQFRGLMGFGHSARFVWFQKPQDTCFIVGTVTK